MTKLSKMSNESSAEKVKNKQYSPFWPGGLPWCFNINNQRENNTPLNLSKRRLQPPYSCYRANSNAFVDSFDISNARFDLSIIFTVLTSSALKIYDSYSLMMAEELLFDLLFPLLTWSSSSLL